ncbi:MAG: tetratricopeptide repeat protein [Planctomycetota bacterium]
MKTNLPALLVPLLLLACGACSSMEEFRKPQPDAEPVKLLEAKLGEIRAASPDFDNLGLWEDSYEIPDHLRAEVRQLALSFPRNPRVLFVNALLAYQAGEKERAQEYLDSLFHFQAAFAPAAVLRARIALDDGNLSLADRVLAHQITLLPGEAELREVYAGILFLEGHLESAQENLTVAVNLGAPFWRVSYLRGLLSEHQGERENATRYYEKALDSRPGFLPAVSRLAALKAGAPLSLSKE